MSLTYKSFLTQLKKKLIINNKKFLSSRSPEEKKKLRETKTTALKILTNSDNLMSVEYSLDNYHRSNQDTCLVNKPSVFEGQWVETGDLLADCSTSVGGELSLGQNILIAYMPWEGYNFEDAILISERLVFDDLYTSIHIEKYEVEIQDTKLGVEEITRQIPDIEEESIKHLDNIGIAKLGSWVEEGDILIGKVSPINKKNQSNYQKLLYTILEKPVLPVRDSSFRAPKGINAKVVGIQIFKKNQKNIERKKQLNSSVLKQKSELQENTKKDSLKKTKLLDSKLITKSDKDSFLKKNDKISNSNIKLIKKSNSVNENMVQFKSDFFYKTLNTKKSKEYSPDYFNISKDYNFRNSKSNSIIEIDKIKLNKNEEILKIKKKFTLTPINQSEIKKKDGYKLSDLFLSQKKTRLAIYNKLKSDKSKLSNQKSKTFEIYFDKTEFRDKKLLNSVSSIQIYLAEKRRIQIGDKMAGRHGNKGIISQILPSEDMPFLPDGTPLDMVLNPLGVPSRMNVGQIYECLLGFAGKYLGENFKVFPFDEIYGAEASRSFVYSKLYESSIKTNKKWLFNPNTPGKTRLYDGRTGEPFDQAVTIGYAYMLRLVHMVDDKIHARSTGPYSLVTQQPLRGRSKQGGQRLGEMEVWALEGYGAAFTLLEMLTIKSDDMTGRMTLWSNLILNKEISIGTPESFKVLICELQALCLDIGLFRVNSERKDPFSNLFNSPPLS